VAGAPTRKKRAVIRSTAHVCCPRCRLRFTPPVAAAIARCPECGDSPQPIASLELTFGFRVIGPEDLPHELPYATAVSVALPRPDSRSEPE
jgi:hypothetical protein